MDEKTKYLNSVVGKKNLVYKGPSKLYKYRPFDKYTFDMLENNYVFLCKASNLDDPTECISTVDADSYYDIVNDCLRRTAAERIIETLRPYSTPENFDLVRSIVYKVMTPNFEIRNNFLIDASFELEKLAPDFNGGNMTPIVNQLANIPKLLDKPEYSAQIKRLISFGLDAREHMGICSLAEAGDIEYMWENYASNETGYCVEYDLSDYVESKNIFPVIYKESKETNIVFIVVDVFLNQMIESFSQGQIETDKSQFIGLFVTKDKKWEYQREWRILGEANLKIEAPKVSKIICGKNIAKGNKEKLKEYCLKKDIRCDEF